MKTWTVLSAIVALLATPGAALSAPAPASPGPSAASPVRCALAGPPERPGGQIAVTGLRDPHGGGTVSETAPPPPPPPSPAAAALPAAAPAMVSPPPIATAGMPTAAAERPAANLIYADAAGIVPSPPGDEASVRHAPDCPQAGGAGIGLAHDTARAARIPGGIDRAILATDGDVNVGVASDEGPETLIRREHDDGITLTARGCGTGNPDDRAMGRLADAGDGSSACIDSMIEARKVPDGALSSTLVTMATDVKVLIGFNPAPVSEDRLIGGEDRARAEADFADDHAEAGDIGAGHQVTALYEIVPAAATGRLPGRHFAANRQSTAAGFAQALRGDRSPGRFAAADAARLAGHPGDHRRSGFVEPAGMAAGLKPGASGES